MITKSNLFRNFLMVSFALIGMGLLFFYGYCWGLWGRRSLLLQYLFQCKCPAASEQARYPDQVDVIISACQNVQTVLSPSGRLLVVYEEESVYLLDLQSNENISLPLPPKSGFQFLTDNLLYVTFYGGDEFI